MATSNHKVDEFACMQKWDGMGGTEWKEWGGWGTGCGPGVRGSVGVVRKAACKWHIGVGKNGGDGVFAGVGRTGLGV